MHVKNSLQHKYHRVIIYCHLVLMCCKRTNHKLNQLGSVSRSRAVHLNLTPKLATQPCHNSNSVSFNTKCKQYIQLTNRVATRFDLFDRQRVVTWFTQRSNQTTHLNGFSRIDAASLHRHLQHFLVNIAAYYELIIMSLTFTVSFYSGDLWRGNLNMVFLYLILRYYNVTTCQVSRKSRILPFFPAVLPY